MLATRLLSMVKFSITKASRLVEILSTRTTWFLSRVKRFTLKSTFLNYKTGAIGSERYSAITDEYGNYSITIPVGQTQINEDLEVTSFTGAYSQIVNGVTYSYDDAIYQNISTTSFLVGAGDQKVVNVTISDKPTFATESLDRSVDVYGEVYVAAESIGYDSTGAVESIVKTLDGLNDDVTIKVSHNSDSRQIYYTIGVSKGLFDETINFYDSWDFSDVIVTLMKTAKTVEEDDSSSEKFTHYYVLKNQTTRNIQYLTGTYSAISKSVSLSDSYMETLDYDMGTSEIYFTPSNISDVLGITDGSPDYECYNPMGW